MTFRLPLAVAAACLTVGALPRAIADDAVAAHPLGQHPAILVKRMQPSIDPNTFVVAHPARLALVATPSPTYDHPAVAVARMARDGDAARLADYMAQPPVAEAWLRHMPTALAAKDVASGG